MGTGIAQVLLILFQRVKETIALLLKKVAAQAQQKVALVDISQDILNKAEKRISESLKWVFHATKKLDKSDHCEYGQSN